MIGRQIARYRIVEQIGSGGMSVVYKGLDTSLEREVAVKVLHPHLASKPDSRRRFSREARAVAKLHHPNILEIFDFSGDEAPESFIVTEYIRGTTLRAFAEQHRFHPPEIAAMAVHELACALEHAHSLGIIHRDLKPENVMIRHDGLIKLMDFGIARIMDRDERMTMTGALVGSPTHMAPEIIEGQEAGPEADIFSLGTILYWLCCRKLPFLGNNTTQTLKLVLEGTFEDPRIACPAVSDELAAIIARCLERDPAARIQGAAELRDALAQALFHAGVERPGEEFTTFFQDPADFSARFEGRLVARLLEEAEACCTGPERNLARTLDALNRVLALQPQNAEARRLLDSMKRRRRRRRQLGIAALTVCVPALLVGAGMMAREQLHVARSAVAASPSAPPPETGKIPGETASAPTPLPTPAEHAPEPAPPPPSDSAPAAPQTTELPPPDDVASTTQPTAEGQEPEGPARPDQDSRPRPSPGGTRVAPVQARPPEKRAAEPRLVAIKFTPAHYARIYLDDKLVNENRPWFEGMVTPGRHRVRIESGSCEPYAGEIDVPTLAEGDPALPPFVFKLERKPALLVVKTPLPDAIVMINGIFRGRAGDSERDPIAVPLPEANRVKGPVRLSLTHEGHRPRELDVEVTAGETRVLQLVLEKL